MMCSAHDGTRVSPLVVLTVAILSICIVCDDDDDYDDYLDFDNCDTTWNTKMPTPWRELRTVKA